MRLPNFSLRHLFVSVTLIAAGCGLVPWARQVGQQTEDIRTVDLLFLVGIFGLIGAGVGNIFRHPILGALLGPPAWIIIAIIIGRLST